jgi:hypothetical protein
MASTPMAAAHSERRLKWRGDMVSSSGLLEGSLEREPRFAIRTALSDATDTGWGRICYGATHTSS